MTQFTDNNVVYTLNPITHQWVSPTGVVATPAQVASYAVITPHVPSHFTLNGVMYTNQNGQWKAANGTLATPAEVAQWAPKAVFTPAQGAKIVNVHIPPHSTSETAIGTSVVQIDGFGTYNSGK